VAAAGHHWELLERLLAFANILQPVSVLKVRTTGLLRLQAMLARRDRKYQETQAQTRRILSQLTALQCANIIGHVEKGERVADNVSSRNAPAAVEQPRAAGDSQA